MAWIAGALMAGLVVGGFTRGDQVSLGLGPLAAGTLLFVLGARATVRPRRWVVAAAALAAFVGGLALVPPRTPPGRAGVWSIEGVVTHRDERGTQIAIEAMGRDGALSPTRSRALLQGVEAPTGALVVLDAELRPRAPFRNPSPHPDWPALEPIAWVGRARPATVRVEAPSALRRAVTGIRERVRAGLVATLRPPTRGLAVALVLGDEEDVDEASAARVRAAGLTHVLAVSGMHVTIVVGAVLFALLRLCRIGAVASRVDPVRVAHAVAAPLALVYAELAGGSPSAWRAAVTAALAWGLRAAGRRPEPIATSALAVVVLAALDPASALRPAFVLSIAATAAVLELPAATTLESLASSSARATVATAPLVLWCFDGVPVVAVIANVLLLPIVGALVLPLATVHALIAAVSPSLAVPSAMLLDLACRGFVGACDALGAVELGRDLPPGDAAQGLVLTVAALALVSVSGARARVAIVASALMALTGAELHLRARELAPDRLRVTFLDVGQGDAALIDLPDGTLTVVDTGGAFALGADPGARVLVPLLRARRRTRIDRLVITHPHPDHYGGVAALARRFPVREVWDSGQARDEDPMGTWSRALDGLGAHAPVLGPAELCGVPREHGGARIDVLWPCPAFDPGWDANDNSLVLRITYRGHVLLLMGDAEAHAEAELLARGVAAPVDVLKVGHHGSRTSSTQAFLDAVRPRLAVVSAGVGNRFGHPHDDVVERLAARGTTTTLRTDREGGVRVTIDATGLHAEAWSGASYERR